jgi:hypothetical protein
LLCEGTENFKLKQSLIKEKFAASMSNEAQTELRRMDLFDLGILLVIAATGGLEVIAEEILN